MSAFEPKPLVGVISDVRYIAPHHVHAVGDKYLRALSQAADVIPVMLPALHDDHDIQQWTHRIDGLFLTGAYSMVNPTRYGEAKLDRAYDYDDRRDELSQHLIQAAREIDLPLFAVCRGMQDINVALGGTLYQAVHETAGFDDHREDKQAPLSEQYGPIHPVHLREGGLLHKLLHRHNIPVNSLHSQGISRLAPGLVVEATADDGLVEAFSIEGMNFGLAVQWHPEWQVMDNPIQRLLFEAFGRACHAQCARGNL